MTGSSDDNAAPNDMACAKARAHAAARGDIPGAARGGPVAASPAASPAAPWPSRAWYIVHILLGVLSGIIVFVLYRHDNPRAARHHLLVSIGLTVLVPLVTFALIFLGAIWS